MLTPLRDFNFASNNTKIKQLCQHHQKISTLLTTTKRLNNFIITTKRFQLCQQQIDFILLIITKRFQFCQQQFKEISALLAPPKDFNFASTIKRFQLHQHLQRYFNFISSNKRFSTLLTPPRDFNFANTTKKFSSINNIKDISTLPIVAKIFQFYKQQ